MYLGGINEIVMNTATLDAMHIKYDHPRLAKFTPKEGEGWDDHRYTGTEFFLWGKDAPGQSALRRIVAGWLENIRLGALAQVVLCEYIDSQIQCFDNKQNYYHTGQSKDVEQQLLRTQLAT